MSNIKEVGTHKGNRRVVITNKETYENLRKIMDDLEKEMGFPVTIVQTLTHIVNQHEKRNK